VRRRTFFARVVVLTLLCLGVVGSFPTRGSAGEPPDCGLGAVKPWNRHDGHVVAKGNIFCLDAGTTLIRMVVRLQYRWSNKADWRTVASETAEITAPSELFVTKIPYPCRTGGWRTAVNTWYRLQPSDPWSSLIGPVRSSRFVEACH
jgi:hypothetical protein